MTDAKLDKAEAVLRVCWEIPPGCDVRALAKKALGAAERDESLVARIQQLGHMQQQLLDQNFDNEACTAIANALGTLAAQP